MTADRWERIKALFQAALDRPSAARAAFLAEACGDEPALRAEVESLLASHEQAASFIENGALHVVPPEAAPQFAGTTTVASCGQTAEAVPTACPTEHCRVRRRQQSCACRANWAPHT